ncbi:hypothetical protein BD408DRAFT_411981 [Parasitella parasitica]|nr:hypothetical protein BD408DRAFT_411981 [Parasitella parasitica]
MSTTVKFTLNELFSFQHKLKSEKILQQVDKSNRRHNIYFSRPNDPRHVELFAEKRYRCSQGYVGIVRCHDYQCIEAIKKGLHQMPNPTTTVLLGGCLLNSLDLVLDKAATLIILLNAGDYVRRSFTVNMSWCRRMWDLASRAHMISLTGVYYSVLGGAYCSLGKSNLKYAYKAGALAVEQIKLAKMLKDPILECKCWLYFAEDLIQLYHVEKAEKIITRQRVFVERNGDAMLRSMLKAVSGKLKIIKPNVCRQ